MLILPSSESQWRAYYILKIYHSVHEWCLLSDCKLSYSYTCGPESKNNLIDTCCTIIKRSFHVWFFTYSADGRHVPGFTNAGRGFTIEGLFHDVPGTYSNIHVFVHCQKESKLLKPKSKMSLLFTICFFSFWYYHAL